MAKTTHPGAPSGTSVSGGKKTTKRRRKGGARSGSTTAGLRARIHRMLGHGRLAQAAEAAVSVGEITLVGGAASALSGYQMAQGKSLRIGPVDGRVLAGLGFLGFSMWTPGKIEPHSLNVGAGFLSSFVHEAAFEQGASFAAGRDVDLENVATAPAAAEGLVIGNVRDQAGAFLGIALTKKAKEKKAERKIARLESKDNKIEAKIDKIKAKVGDGRTVDRGHPGVPVPRGTRVFGPRGHILPKFRASHPAKAHRIHALIAQGTSPQQAVRYV